MPIPTLAPMPESLDVAPGYTIRVTAIDPTTGALVAGVSINTVVITAEQGSSNVGTGGGPAGDWQLIPGPNA